MIELTRIKNRAINYGFSEKHWQCRSDIEALATALEAVIAHLKVKPSSYASIYALDSIKSILRIAEKRTKEDGWVITNDSE